MEFEVHLGRRCSTGRSRAPIVEHLDPQALHDAARERDVLGLDADLGADPVLRIAAERVADVGVVGRIQRQLLLLPGEDQHHLGAGRFARCAPLQRLLQDVRDARLDFPVTKFGAGQHPRAIDALEVGFCKHGHVTTFRKVQVQGQEGVAPENTPPFSRSGAAETF